MRQVVAAWEPYRPGNGTEGELFHEAWCSRCARDNFNEDTMRGGCRILANTLFYDLGDPNYPKEWIRRANDDEWPGSARCTAFVPRSELSVRAKRAWQTRRENVGRASLELFD